MGQGINEQNCLHRYNIAQRFGFKDVMEKCKEEARFLSSNELEKSGDFWELEIESKFNLCMARVKDLENTLRKYAEICSNLVSGYYQDVSSQVPRNIDNECKNKSSHRLHKENFDYFCGFCRNRISSFAEMDDFNDIFVNALHFDDLFFKLYDIENDDKVAKIIKQI